MANVQEILEQAFPGVTALAKEVATLRQSNETLKTSLTYAQQRKEYYKALATGAKVAKAAAPVEQKADAKVRQAVTALRNELRFFRELNNPGYNGVAIKGRKASATKVMADTLFVNHPAVKQLRDALRPFRDFSLFSGSPFLKAQRPTVTKAMADTLNVQNGY